MVTTVAGVDYAGVVVERELWCGTRGAGAPVDHKNIHMNSAATRITWRVRFGLLMGSADGQ
jgi:hypothetical protein